MQPVELRCENAYNPQGIDAPQPCLSWRFLDLRRGARQTAYRILVASGPEQLAADEGDLWDSGKVDSDQSIIVPYEGRLLASRQRVWWKVRYWDQQGEMSAWSMPAFWQMGILEREAWRGRWITAPEMTEPESDQMDHFLTATCMTTESKQIFHNRKPIVLFRKSFHVNEGVKFATARICGLGAFNLYVNGTKVGDAFLDPISSDYDRIAYYKSFDIKSVLVTGENAIGIEVADGWYGQFVVWNGIFGYGNPRLIAEIEWADSNENHRYLGTDHTWKVHFGPTLRSNIYAGEYHDSRLEQPGWSNPEFDDASWVGAVETTAGSPCLVSQVTPSIRAIRTIRPVNIRSPKPGMWIFDFGEHFAGVARIRVRNAQAGAMIIVQFGDFLNPDGTISHDLMVANQVRQTQAYVCRGGETEDWTPTFTYFGFRYAEVKGLENEPESDLLEAIFISTAVRPIGEFHCSLSLYNKMHEMAVQTMMSNIHGIPEDCPHREKCGWLGDAWMPMESWLYNYDLFTFYRKFIEDIRQSYYAGSSPREIAGGKRHYGPPAMLDWMAATLIIPWYHYVYTGDRIELARHYPYMIKFVDAAIPLICARYKSGNTKLTRRERFFFGDWGDITVDGKRNGDFLLFPSETPAMLSGTQSILHGLQCFAAAADVLGHQTDNTKATAMVDTLIRLANMYYFDPATASYGSQSANAWALKLGMVEPEFREKFLRRFGQEIREVDGLVPTSGQMGLATIFQSLTEAGHANLVHELADAKVGHGFRRLIERGATTLWEFQGRGEPVPMGSGNHPAFGGYDVWFYQYLAGIRPDPAHPGFKQFTLAPVFVDELTFARASYLTPHGKIVSDWERKGKYVTWIIDIPPNTTAKVFVSVRDLRGIKLDGMPADNAEGVKLMESGHEKTAFLVSSGRYVWLIDTDSEYHHDRNSTSEKMR